MCMDGRIFWRVVRLHDHRRPQGRSDTTPRSSFAPSVVGQQILTALSVSVPVFAPVSEPDTPSLIGSTEWSCCHSHHWAGIAGIDLLKNCSLAQAWVTAAQLD